MKARKLLALFTLIMVSLFLQACGGIDTQPAIDTAIAQTLQIAQLETAAAGVGQVQATTAAPEQASNTPLPSDQPAITITPASTYPLTSVTANTNCRSGPREDYSLITTVNVGQQVEVVAVYAASNYVVIRNPNGAGTCWLWMQYATTTNFSAFNLPAATQPPTPQVSITITAKANVGKVLTGACPILVQFDGTITVNGPVALSYYWERSNGSVSGTVSLTFVQASSKFVHDRMELGTPGATINMWDRLHITTPQNVVSHQATFEYNCP